jgi:ankyrin repeat protein
MGLKFIKAILVMLIVTSSAFSQKKLLQAIKAEDTIALQKLVKGKKLYKEYGYYKRVPMMLACMEGNIKSVKFLLNQGYDVNYQNSNFKLTALQYAIVNKHNDITKLLLEHKANPNIKGTGGTSPFLIASKYGDVETIKMLLENGADINSEDESGHTALIKAIKRGKTEITDYLLSKEQDFEHEDKEQWTPLMYACRYSNAATVEKMLGKGASVSKKNKEGHSPLALAVHSVQEFYNERLLITWNTQTQKWDYYVLNLFKYFNKEVKELMESLKSNYGVEPFEFKGSDEYGYAYWLYNTGGKKHEFEVWVENAQKIVNADNIKKIELLLRKGADVNAKAVNGNTPLLDAVNLCQNQMIKVLLDNKADAAIANNEGISPQSLAAFTGNSQLLNMAGRSTTTNYVKATRIPPKDKCLIYISRSKTFKSSITPYKLVYVNSEYVADINPGEYFTIEVDPGIFTLFVSAPAYIVNAQAGSIICLSWDKYLNKIKPIEMLPYIKENRLTNNYRLVRKISGGIKVQKILNEN